MNLLAVNTSHQALAPQPSALAVYAAYHTKRLDCTTWQGLPAWLQVVRSHKETNACASFAQQTGDPIELLSRHWIEPNGEGRIISTAVDLDLKAGHEAGFARGAPWHG